MIDNINQNVFEGCVALLKINLPVFECGIVLGELASTPNWSSSTVLSSTDR